MEENPMNTVLQTKGLCKTYIVNKRQNNVLKNIDLTIHEAHFSTAFRAWTE